MRKVELLPTQDCEVGYGPVLQGAMQPKILLIH